MLSPHGGQSLVLTNQLTESTQLSLPKLGLGVTNSPFGGAPLAGKEPVRRKRVPMERVCGPSPSVSSKY
jgi:hypothetical protein